MLIQFLGAHNCESNSTRHVCLLVDDTLAVDAGAITSSLSFSSQMKIKAVLITHQHYDHIRDIPALAMNFYLREANVAIYATDFVYRALTAHMLNDALYPNFLQKPEGNPTIKFTRVTANSETKILGYQVKAVSVKHAEPTVGYQITSTEGKSVFYTGDTGPGLADCWQQISPQLLVVEVTAPNRWEDFAKRTGHLTPVLLKQELESFRNLKNYLPRVVTVHMNPALEKEIESEIAAVAGELDADIRLSHEGEQIQL